MLGDSGEELAKVLYYYGLIGDTKKTEYKISCPLHYDTNPSMNVSFEKGIVTCYVCNITTDAFGLVKHIEEKSGITSELQVLRKYIKILKSKEAGKINYKLVKKKKRSNSQQRKLAYDNYNGLLDVDWKKGSGEDFERCKSYMKGRGFKADTLNKYGAKVTYERNYPIVFPIYDNKKFKGIMKRTDRKDVEEHRKYLYNEGLERNTTLVGEYGNTKTCVICEGYFDAMLAWQHGLREFDIVAIFGWYISEEQIQKLKDAGVKNIISMLDNDKCGKDGTKRLEKYFRVARFKFLKGYKDVGEMNQNTFLKCWDKTKSIYNIKK